MSRDTKRYVAVPTSQTQALMTSSGSGSDTETDVFDASYKNGGFRSWRTSTETLVKRPTMKRHMNACQCFCFGLTMLFLGVVLGTVFWLPATAYGKYLNYRKLLQGWPRETWTEEFLGSIETDLQLVNVTEGEQYLVFGFQYMNGSISEGYGIPEYVYGGLVAFDQGGNHMWDKKLNGIPQSLICEGIDIDGNGVNDCIVAGSNGTLLVVNGETGDMLWEMKDILPGNLSTAMLVPDLNGDGKQELVMIFNEDLPDLPHVERSAIVIADPNTGSLLGQGPMLLSGCAHLSSLEMNGNDSILTTCTDFTKTDHVVRISLSTMASELEAGKRSLTFKTDTGLVSSDSMGLIEGKNLLLTWEAEDSLIFSLKPNLTYFFQHQGSLWEKEVSHGQVLYAFPMPCHGPSCNADAFFIKYLTWTARRKRQVQTFDPSLNAESEMSNKMQFPNDFDKYLATYKPREYDLPQSWPPGIKHVPSNVEKLPQLSNYFNPDNHNDNDRLSLDEHEGPKSPPNYPFVLDRNPLNPEGEKEMPFPTEVKLTQRTMTSTSSSSEGIQSSTSRPSSPASTQIPVTTDGMKEMTTLHHSLAHDEQVLTELPEKLSRGYEVQEVKEALLYVSKVEGYEAEEHSLDEKTIHRFCLKEQCFPSSTVCRTVLYGEKWTVVNAVASVKTLEDGTFRLITLLSRSPLAWT